MEESQEQKVQSQSPEQKTKPTPPLQPPVSSLQSSVSWKTIGITVGILILGLLVLAGMARQSQQKGRLEQWKERGQRRPTVYQPPTTVPYPSPTLIPLQPTTTTAPRQPTLSPVPTISPGFTYEVSVTEAGWNNSLKEKAAESQNKTYPLTSLTVSLYEGSGRVKAVWTTGAAYTAELYIDETGKELRLRNPEFTGAGSLNESYRNSATDVFQAEITAAIKSHFSNRLDHIEFHSGKVVFFYR